MSSLLRMYHRKELVLLEVAIYYFSGIGVVDNAGMIMMSAGFQLFTCRYGMHRHLIYAHAL